MNYHFADGSGFVTVATTRPETYFGDTCYYGSSRRWKI